jgi:phage-related protein
MGWFSDLWEGVKSGVSNVWSGAKNIAGKVYDVVRKPIDIIAGAGDFVSKIPVLGSLAQPFIAGAKGAQSLLDQAKTVGDVVRATGLQDGGMVKRKNYYQA